jgi:hypothetical protein
MSLNICNECLKKYSYVQLEEKLYEVKIKKEKYMCYHYYISNHTKEH